MLLTSQKAGSTSAAKWFFLQAGVLEDARAHSRWIHDYEQQVFVRRPGYLRGFRRRLRDGSPVVKIVRDPASRAYSGYLQLNEHWAVLQRLDHWTVYWRTRVIRDLFGPGADYITPFSFEQYVDWLVEQDPHRVNPHLAPQRTRLEESLGSRLTVRRLEDGPTLFSDLEACFGLEPTDEAALGSLLSSGHHTDKAPADPDQLRAALSTGYVAHRPPDSVFPEVRTDMLRHAPELGAKIRRWFASDYAAYGHLYPAR